MSSSPSAESAKQKVAACEKEISAIKTRLRALGPASTAAAASEEASEANSLTVAWIKTEGLPEAAEPSLKLQLSSPIEDAVLSSLFDPLAKADESAAGDADASTNINPTTVVFRGVETGQATLTISASDKDIPLGSSIAYDVETLTAASPDKDDEEAIVTELPVAILPTESIGASQAQQEEENEEAGETKAKVEAQDAICTVTLRLTFQPSLKDKREALYERLNQASRQKAQAVEQLRQVALAASRQQFAAASAAGTGSANTPRSRAAVQSGFLNKKKAPPKTRWQEWYDNYLGPNSFVRRNGPVAKNYILFAGIVSFFHFQGQLLALPPPV